MIDQRDALQRPEVVRVSPKPEGRGLPLPPLLPIVAIVFLFGGIAIGYRLGAANPAPTPIQTASAPADSSTLVAEASPTSTTLTYFGPGPTSNELPPAGGITLASAVDSIKQAGLGASPLQVISAHVARLGQIDPTNTRYPPEAWMWSISVRSGRTTCLECVPGTTLVVILSYATGGLVETYLPGAP